MKRNPKPFSVEIKKSRDPGQRRQPPPRHLFETTLAETNKIFRKEEPRATVESSAGRRILPSIVEPVWSSWVPVEPVRRKRFSGKAVPEQMEPDLTATVVETVTGAYSEEALVIAKAVLQTEVAPVVSEEATPAHNAQPVQSESLKVRSRRLRKKASQAVEPITASKPEPMQVAEVIEPLVVTSLKAGERRLTKRQAATVQLPRYERWKRRLHPASW